MELNRQQIQDMLRTALSYGGPFGALIVYYTGVSADVYGMWLAVALLVLPPIVSWIWGYIQNRRSQQIAAIARLSPVEQQQALNKTTDAAKVLIAEAVPNVETVVVNNQASGELGKLANDPARPNIVTAKQNEIDAKTGTGTSWKGIAP